MASNPMQRKARNSFLLGMLITLIVTGLIIALLFIQLKNYKEKEQEEIANSVKIYVLSSGVKSGEIITTNMLTTKVVNNFALAKQTTIVTTQLIIVLISSFLSMGSSFCFSVVSTLLSKNS